MWLSTGNRFYLRHYIWSKYNLLLKMHLEILNKLIFIWLSQAPIHELFVSVLPWNTFEDEALYLMNCQTNLVSCPWRTISIVFTFHKRNKTWVQTSFHFLGRAPLFTTRWVVYQKSYFFNRGLKSTFELFDHPRNIKNRNSKHIAAATDRLKLLSIKKNSC